MFKGYISNTIRHVQWTIHTQSSFLIPYLERISDGISKKSKETTDDTLLTIIRKIKPACTVKEYFRSGVSQEERRDVLKKFGKLSRDIHDSRIKQDDFSLNNFLVYGDKSGER